MTFEQIIQQVGKEIELSVLYEENGVASVIGYDDIKRVKITFNCGLTGSVMNGIELELYTALPDVPITLSVTAKFGEDTATKLYQNYHFKEAPTYNADSKTYTHILYDEMINLMVEYQPITITYPTTLIQFFQRLVTELNLTTDISSLPNGNRTIAQDPYTGINYTYRDALDDIGQATGTLFKVDNTEIIKCNLGTTAKVIDDDILKNQNISMGKHFGPINVIVLSRAGGSDNIYYPSTLPENPIEYKITDNILMNDNNRADYLQELYSALYGISYDIYDCQLVGYGGFEPLDKVQIRTYEGQELKSYNSYVFNNEIVMNGGGYEESIYTELPEETNTEYQYADTTDRRINQTYLIVDKQNRTITSVVSEVDGQNSKISQITQDVNEIKAEISNISGMTMTAEGYGTINFEDITPESGPVNMKIYPVGESISCLYPNFSLYPTTQNYPAQGGLVPSNSLTPSNSLVPSTGYPAQTIKYPKVRRVIFHNITTSEDIPFDLPDDLLYYDSTHYDEFYLDVKSVTYQVTKKCKYNADGTIGLLANPRIDDYSRGGTYLPDIDLKEGQYSVYVQGVSGPYLNVTLMSKNLYTDQFYTKHETNRYVRNSIEGVAIGEYDWYTNLDGRVTGNSGEILVNKNSITAEVTARTNADGELSSRIKQTARSIELGVDDNGTSCGLTIRLKNEDGTQLDEKTGNITLSGLVKFTDLSGTGTTTINGANIMTGTIVADKLNVQNLSSVSSDLGDIRGGSIDIGQGKFVVASNGTLTSTAGNITFGGGKLKLTNGGSLRYYDSPGFLTCANTNHPYMSALNLAYSSTGEIVFRTGTSIDSPGSAVGHISHTRYTPPSGGGYWYNMQIYNDDNINVDCGRNIALSPGSSGYVKIGNKYFTGDHIRFNANNTTTARITSGGESIYLVPQSSGKAYYGERATGNEIARKGEISSKNVKKNFVEINNYDLIYNDLKNLKMYDYDFKYDNIDEAKYGFVIDEIEKTEYLSKYFKDYSAKKYVKGNKLYDSKIEGYEKEINVKEWDLKGYVKGLFILIKALQKEIEELKK